jgi:hypothetical protein
LLESIYLFQKLSQELFLFELNPPKILLQSLLHDRDTVCQYIE